MFWIGMIVGAFTFILLSCCFVAWCMHVSGVSLSEFKGMASLNTCAIQNRESRIEVWHEGMLLNDLTLKTE